uniref:Uncharacterized protein n=1 Tax=Glossina palpalis gambiensis TaxID=67801 RepID=A0A1B0BU57_9MUSC
MLSSGLALNYMFKNFTAEVLIGATSCCKRKDYFFAGFVATTCLRLYSVCSEYASVLMIFQGDGAQVIGRSSPLTGTTNPRFEHNDLRNNCSLGVDHSRTEFSNIVQLFTNVMVVKFKSQKCFRLIDASLNLQIKAEFIIMCDAQIYEVRNEGQLMGINIRARSYQNSPKYVKSKIT